MNAMKRIHEARAVVREQEREAEECKSSLKMARESLAVARANLDRLIDDDASGVQELPLGDDDDEDDAIPELERLANEGAAERKTNVKQTKVPGLRRKGAMLSEGQQ